ncbi:MAG: helical backbone metal receptor [Candidatus Bathyarchaeota archaeon]|jgi:iron complex transport system substrate-binding protein
MEKIITYIVAIIAIIALVVGSYGFVAFQGQISDLETSNTDLEASMSDIQSTLSDIQVQIGEYQENITQLEEELSGYKEITLVDDLGNVVVLTEPPERIVSLAPSNTEILFAVGAGDKVVGVTNVCDYPYNFTAWIEAGNMSSIGPYWQPAVEPIITLDPDLVFASTASEEAAETLKNLGYNVLIVEPKTINGVLESILLIGRATGNHVEAGEFVNEIRDRMDAVINTVAGATSTPKVYYEVWGPDIQSAGPGTFIDELITLAGGENIFHDAGTSFPMVSSETVIMKNPDVIIFPHMYMGTVSWGTYADIESRPGWDSITAIQNDNFHIIDASIISRSGPRLVDALETIAEIINPELFG